VRLLSSWESWTCDSVTGSDARRRIASNRARDARDGQALKHGDAAHKQRYDRPDELKGSSR